MKPKLEIPAIYTVPSNPLKEMLQMQGKMYLFDAHKINLKEKVELTEGGVLDLITRTACLLENIKQQEQGEARFELVEMLRVLLSMMIAWDMDDKEIYTKFIAKIKEENGKR